MVHFYKNYNLVKKLHNFKKDFCSYISFLIFKEQFIRLNIIFFIISTPADYTYTV